jgi:DNA-directed RNA polymerase subunit RPC12/RpoP
MAKIIGTAGGAGQQPPKQPKLDLKASKPMVCTDCGFDIFVSGAKFRTISRLVTSTPQDVIIPIDVYLCGDCGKVNEKLLPEEIKKLDSKNNG